MGILSQICEIFESRYLEKYALDQHEILRGISGAKMDFVGGPALQNYNEWNFAVMYTTATGNRPFDQNRQK